MTDPEVLERIAARRAELDGLEEQLAGQLAEVRAERDELAVAERVLQRMSVAQMGDFMGGDEPSQTWKEYDPEWARAFASGSAGASCDHARMLASVKVPVLFSHHFWKVDEETGRLQGAISDLQVRHMRELITQAGQRFDYKSFPKAGHVMHQSDPQTYVAVLRDWISSLDARHWNRCCATLRMRTRAPRPPSM
ncbi:hypothetical protein ABZ746_35385 [Streptomyces sp. NPDC020096]